MTITVLVDADACKRSNNDAFLNDREYLTSKLTTKINYFEDCVLYYDRRR